MGFYFFGLFFAFRSFLSSSSWLGPFLRFLRGPGSCEAAGSRVKEAAGCRGQRQRSHQSAQASCEAVKEESKWWDATESLCPGEGTAFGVCRLVWKISRNKAGVTRINSLLAMVDLWKADFWLARVLFGVCQSKVQSVLDSKQFRANDSSLEETLPYHSLYFAWVRACCTSHSSQFCHKHDILAHSYTMDRPRWIDRLKRNQRLFDSWRNYAKLVLSKKSGSHRWSTRRAVVSLSLFGETQATKNNKQMNSMRTGHGCNACFEFVVMALALTGKEAGTILFNLKPFTSWSSPLGPRSSLFDCVCDNFWVSKIVPAGSLWTLLDYRPQMDRGRNGQPVSFCPDAPFPLPGGFHFGLGALRD